MSLFIFGCAGSLLLHGLFSRCGGQALPFISGYGFSFFLQSRDAKARGLQQLWHLNPVAGVPGSEHRLDGCGTWAYLLCGMWDLPGPGIGPLFPALVSRFFTTELPGKLWILGFRSCCTSLILELVSIKPLQGSGYLLEMKGIEGSVALAYLFLRKLDLNHFTVSAFLSHYFNCSVSNSSRGKSVSALSEVAIHNLFIS